MLIRFQSKVTSVLSSPTGARLLFLEPTLASGVEWSDRPEPPWPSSLEGTMKSLTPWTRTRREKKPQIKHLRKAILSEWSARAHSPTASIKRMLSQALHMTNITKYLRIKRAYTQVVLKFFLFVSTTENSKFLLVSKISDSIVRHFQFPLYKVSCQDFRTLNLCLH